MKKNNSTPLIQTVIEKKKKKYATDELVSLVNTIHSLGNNDYYHEIVNLLIEDKIKYSYNSSGVIIDIEKVPDSTIDKIKTYLSSIEKKKLLNIENVSKKFKNMVEDDKYSNKISNYEKSVIKMSRKKD